MKEMVGGCCVCSDERGWTENPLVYCDGQGCNVAVHQACYGIVTVPTGPWFCRKCESQERAARVPFSWQRCELCPSKDGALKRTDNGGWAHVVCALYIPEVRFGNVTTMEPIILQLVPPDRFNKPCCICEEDGKESRANVGACMQCNKSGCKHHFHVTCAQALGLLCEEAGNYLDNVKYCGYCQYHYSKLKKSVNVKIIPPYRPVPQENVSSDSSPEKEITSHIVDMVREGKGKKKMGKTSIGGRSPASSIASASKNGSTTSEAPEIDSDAGKKKEERGKFTTANFTETSVTPGESVFGSERGKKKKGGGTSGSKTPPTPASTPVPSTPVTNIPPVPDVECIPMEVAPETDNQSPTPPPPPPPPAPPSTEPPLVEPSIEDRNPTPPLVPIPPPISTPLPSLTPSPATTPGPTPPVVEQTNSEQPKEEVSTIRRVRTLTPGEKMERPRKQKRSNGGGRRGGRGGANNVPVPPPTAVPPESPPSSPSSEVGVGIKRTMKKKKEEKEPARSMFANGLSAPHMMGNTLNPSSTMAQKMSDTLSAEMEAHSVFGEASSSSCPPPLIGPPVPGKGSSTTRGGSGGLPSFPQSLEQLLERQWEQGSQFLMEQAQHFDIASLLTCLYQLRQENQRLEEHVDTLTQRRDHLLAVNARLSLPLGSSTTTTTNTAPTTSAASNSGGSTITSTPLSNMERASSRLTSGYSPIENGVPEHYPSQINLPPPSLPHGPIPHSHQSQHMISHRSPGAERVVPSPVVMHTSSQSISNRHSPASASYLGASSMVSTITSTPRQSSDPLRTEVLRSFTGSWLGRQGSPNDRKPIE